MEGVAAAHSGPTFSDQLAWHVLLTRPLDESLMIQLNELKDAERFEDFEGYWGVGYFLITSIGSTIYVMVWIGVVENRLFWVVHNCKP